jgi:glyoxylase-like metal-dependent hydrolase (beta-lactamase superfamily II)
MADPLEEAFFLNDMDPIPFRSMTWETIHCPGHTIGSICFYYPEKRILFAGDHLLKGITPNPTLNNLKGGPPFQYGSLKQYLNSLRKIEKLDVLLILPGHGKEITNSKVLIQRMFIHHWERMNRILYVLSDREKTAYEIAVELFTGLSPFEVLLGISEVLGHLQILKEKGKIKVKERRKKDYYSLRI